MTAYVCVGCNRTVDPALEISPGEPTRCGDCFDDYQRDFAEWLAGGWGA